MNEHLLHVKKKRAYESPDSGDGVRILVDRLWPRGMSKSRADIDIWMKEIAPSDALRKWYGHRPERFSEFAKRYSIELHSGERREYLRRLREMAAHKTVTLVYAAKDEEHSNARVLADELVLPGL